MLESCDGSWVWFGNLTGKSSNCFTKIESEQTNKQLEVVFHLLSTQGLFSSAALKVAIAEAVGPNDMQT